MINHTLHNVTMLKQYKHRQVVLNFYESDMLIHRVGFFFEEIIFAEEAVMFMNDGRIHFVIDVSAYDTFAVKTDFPRYFELIKKESKVELYFP